MRVLVVARCKIGQYAPFVTEQVEAIKKQGVVCKYYGITGKGIAGYLRQFPGLMKAIREFRPDLIHAHYGLCGLLANYQRKVPVVTTYHGSDINAPKAFRFSKKAIRRSRFNIFVSQKNVDIARPRDNYALIPCGINLEDSPIIEKSLARQQMGLHPSRKYVLFASAFDNRVKNAPLAQEAMKRVPEATLLELKGYTRPQVASLMQAVDAFLMTSFTEGSPQVIKEAMACGCPIVSVDVGDVRERIEEIPGCYIANRDAESIAGKLKEAIAFEGRTLGRMAVVDAGLSNDSIATRIISIYKSLIS